VARAILGPDALIGLSTHAPAELGTARREPVDYVSVGPVVATPTKPGRPGTGLDYVRTAVIVLGEEGLPFFVTGGASPDSLPELMAAGASRFVVVRALTESPDPVSVVRRLRGVMASFA
jgi:thiamine-phosphate pyrophosphorylase